MLEFVCGYDKFGNLAARKDSINDVEETFTYDNYVQDPLKYTDPTGERRIGPSYAELMYLAEQEARNNAWNEIGRTVEDIGVKNANSINMSFCITWGEKNGCGDNHDNSGTGNGYDVPETKEGQTPEQEGEGGTSTQTGNGQNGTQSNNNVGDNNKNTLVDGVSETATLVGGIAGDELRTAIKNAEIVSDVDGFGLNGIYKIGIGVNVICIGIDVYDDYMSVESGDMSKDQFWAKTTVSVAIFATAFIPGVCTYISLSLTIANSAGAFDWFYKKF